MIVDTDLGDINLRHPDEKNKSLFAQQHHKKIASLLAYQYTGEAQNDSVVDRIVEEFSEMFARDNAAFKSGKFHVACGYTDNPPIQRKKL